MRVTVHRCSGVEDGSANLQQRMVALGPQIANRLKNVVKSDVASNRRKVTVSEIAERLSQLDA